MSGFTYYRPSLFHLSKTCYDWVKLTAADVQTLTQPDMYKGSKVYFHLNNPIQYVRVVGVIVGVYEYEQRSILQLDDGSNTLLRILVPHDLAPKKFKGLAGPLFLSAGMVVKAKGSLMDWHGTLQMKLKAVELLTTTDEEVAAWRSMVKAREIFWGKPWVLSEQQIEEADRKREEELMAKLPKEKKFVGRKRKRKEGEEEDKVEKKVKKGESTGVKMEVKEEAPRVQAPAPVTFVGKRRSERVPKPVDKPAKQSGLIEDSDARHPKASNIDGSNSISSTSKAGTLPNSIPRPASVRPSPAEDIAKSRPQDRRTTAKVSGEGRAPSGSLRAKDTPGLKCKSGAGREQNLDGEPKNAMPDELEKGCSKSDGYVGRRRPGTTATRVSISSSKPEPIRPATTTSLDKENPSRRPSTSTSTKQHRSAVDMDFKVTKANPKTPSQAKQGSVLAQSVATMTEPVDMTHYSSRSKRSFDAVVNPSEPPKFVGRRRARPPG